MPFVLHNIFTLPCLWSAHQRILIVWYTFFLFSGIILFSLLLSKAFFRDIDYTVNVADKFNSMFPEHHMREDLFITCVSYKNLMERHSRIYDELSFNNEFWV